MTLRVVFMGSPAFSLPVLDAVVSRHEAIAAYTRRPAASGRGMRERPSPVGARAAELGLPVETPRTLRDPEAASRLAAFRPDVVVVVAYGLILPQPILDVPRFGCLNLHASLLPRWRGAAPIHRAVLAGDRETGIAVMRMEAGLDTGPVGLEERVAIGPDTTTGELHDLLASRGGALMAEALDRLEAGQLTFVPQPDEGVTYAAKITNDEARIDWDRPGRACHDGVRGLSPSPGAFFVADLGRGPERVKVLRTAPAEGSGPPGTLLDATGRVACREGAVRLVTVQRAGRGPVSFDEFLRGSRLEPGALLGAA